jgi:hypothetical protein
VRVGRRFARTRAPLLVAIGTALAVAGLAPATPPLPSALAQSKGTSARVCGEVVTLATHDRTTTRYALAGPKEAPAGDRVALVLLVGSGGDLDLDDRGCPRALKGNSLVRSLPYFHAEGFFTALVDVPSDHRGEEGLAGFRTSSDHAADLGLVITDVRRRTSGSVWVVGTSRGTISAANVASRFTSLATPDGLVLTSAVTSGSRSGRRAWVSQTVFDLKLDAIRSPVLVVGHADDQCARTPPDLMRDIAAKTRGSRQQVVVVKGGPGLPAGTQAGLDACEGRTPHGFIEQEAEVAAGIARFIRGGTY